MYHFQKRCFSYFKSSRTWSKQPNLERKQNVILFLCIWGILETVQSGGHKIKERIEPVCPARVPILNNMPGLCALTVRPQLQPEYDKNRGKSP